VLTLRIQLPLPGFASEKEIAEAMRQAGAGCLDAEMAPRLGAGLQIADFVLSWRSWVDGGVDAVKAYECSGKRG